ncbi:MAG: aspartate dehydrogenase [bacterium]|jgi:aspartate dehydrogenase|nr:aspartate dehydrogenase [Betaproteobacteria bacterium]
MALKLGMIGMGAIGQETLRCLARPDAGIEGGPSGVALVAALVTDPSRHAGAPHAVVTDVASLLAAAPDLVVEAASQAAFIRHVPQVLAAGCDVIAGSIGALADDAVMASIVAAAAAGRSRLFIPSGALAGIDALAGARLIGIDTVEYTRSAPPSTWAAHDAARGRDLSALEAPLLVWEGNARDAARTFPKNANVAALIALAGIGFARTRVRIFADPSLTANLHALRASGPFGRLHAEIVSTRIGDTSSSRIVAGSLARSVLCHAARIAI